MTELLTEILIRAMKLVIAGVVAIPVYLVATAAGAAPGPELALLAWIAAGVGVVLVETGAF